MKSSLQKTPIVVELNSSGFSYYRVFIDDTIFKEGELRANTSTMLTLDKAFRISFSNDNFVDITINNNTFALQKRGLPRAFYVLWNPVNDTQYSLQAIPLP